MHEKLLQLERRITDKMFELQMIILKEGQVSVVRKYDDVSYDDEIKPNIYALTYRSLDETSDVDLNRQKNLEKEVLEINVNINVKSEKIRDSEVFRFNVTVPGTNYKNCFNYSRKINRSDGIVEEIHENEFRVSNFINF